MRNSIHELFMHHKRAGAQDTGLATTTANQVMVSGSHQSNHHRKTPGFVNLGISFYLGDSHAVIQDNTAAIKLRSQLSFFSGVMRRDDTVPAANARASIKPSVAHIEIHTEKP